MAEQLELRRHGSDLCGLEPLCNLCDICRACSVVGMWCIKYGGVVCRP